MVFIIYHYNKALELPASYWAQSAWHGLSMDISFASYLLVVPTLLMSFTFRQWNWYRRLMQTYTFVTTLIIALLVCIDLELFRAWGFRIDGTSLHYLNTPKEAWASMSAAPIGLVLFIGILLFLLSNAVLNRVNQRQLPHLSRVKPWALNLLVFLVTTSAWIIPIRGGFQLAPMNQSTVFFSDKSFANYAAVNVPWNYASSLIHSTHKKDNPFKYAPDSLAQELVQDLYAPADKITEQLLDPSKLDSTKLNVIVLIWESFTAKVVEPLGGMKGITPHFNGLIGEGILFNNLYASGNRSDKGMVAILSGYPAQPTESIIKIPTKTTKLPSLPKSFHRSGYHTAYYYGGETEFANMKSYFLQQDFDKLIDINAFEKKEMNSKWGAHDHIVLNRLLEDLDHTPTPFFTTLFTLSSHEPFEVPMATVIPGNGQQEMFLNAMHYSDRAIGNFIEQAKKKPWWDNTLIIIVADHGHPLPESNLGKPSEFHIPMLWLGGALQRKGEVVEALSSQTDLAATLLNQLNLPSNEFVWSNDILNPSRKPFAYFAFNNGFGWMRPQGFLIHDNLGGNIIGRQGSLNDSELNIGKAYLQTSFNDYLSR
ncbi:LTA synthase family protein [Dyadobacter tibetensis]|uniref:LTA synthase family protein n=1 Tax=Dyadobacter tibetensis TaxID=1211851 RepID=UPI0004B0AE65|nr:LTA synthase family protein [Dyadobacter tibetensis]